MVKKAKGIIEESETKLPDEQTFLSEEPLERLNDQLQQEEILEGEQEQNASIDALLSNQDEQGAVEENLNDSDQSSPQEDSVAKDSVAMQKQKLDQVEQSVSKQSSKKSKITNLIFFFVNIAVVVGILVYQISKEPLIPLTGFRLDISSVFVCIFLFICVIFVETLGTSYLLKISTGKWRPAISYKVSQIGKYYDAVTPMATGGQPFQITYLKNHGVPIHTALSIPLAKYVFNQIAWVVVSLICLIIANVDKSYGTFVSVMSVIGFILSSIVLFFTLFLSICKTVGKKLVVKFLKLLHKMKIVKNYDKQYEKITKYISDFQDVMKQYARSPKDFLIMLTLSFGKLFLNYAIPFFVVKLFDPGIESSMFIKLLVMSVLVDVSASFFPMPGGTGLNEISFTAAFEMVVSKKGVLVWVLLFWRFFSYYIYLIQGVSIISYDMAYGNRKYKWQVRKSNLAQESAVFKQKQIERFRNERAKRRKNKQKISRFE